MALGFLLNKHPDRVLIFTTGDNAYRRSDGVAVVPLAHVGP